MVKNKLGLVGLVSLIFLILSPRGISQPFYRSQGEIYDSWHICRTRPQGIDGYFQVGEDGFYPLVVFESLGRNANVAYKLGEEFKARYPDPYYRAEAIYSFARDKVRYTHDRDLFGYPEFAQNADELAEEINKGEARGDCEDYAILLATLFKAAGYRTAIVLIPGHAAALVFLPGYPKARVFLTFSEESGWIWAEATGRRNPLGWVPQKALGAQAVAFEIEKVPSLDRKPFAKGEITEIQRRRRIINISPFLFIIFLMWVIPMIARVFLIGSLRRRY